jgi:hypothetical protein
MRSERSPWWARRRRRPTSTAPMASRSRSRPPGAGYPKVADPAAIDMPVVVGLLALPETKDNDINA